MGMGVGVYTANMMGVDRGVYVASIMGMDRGFIYAVRYACFEGSS
jgi:hypothetical protein